jgi:hypothetical protein
VALHCGNQFTRVRRIGLENDSLKAMATQAYDRWSDKINSVADVYKISVVFKEKRFGGAKRDRTADLLHAMQALSQLSYSPIKVVPEISGPGMLREALCLAEWRLITCGFRR